MKGPALEIGDFHIDEFMGTLTDTLLALLALFFFFQLKKLAGEKGTRNLLLGYFLTFSISSFLGGVLGHGLLYLTGPYGKLPGFALAILSVFMLELAILRLAAAHLKPGFFRFLYSFSIAVSISCLLLTLWSPKFIWTGIHTAYGMLLVIGSLSIFMIRRKLFVPAFLSLLWTLFFSAVSAVIFVYQIAPHTWFNHLDFSHVFLGISTWFIFRASKHLLQNTADN